MRWKERVSGSGLISLAFVEGECADADLIKILSRDPIHDLSIESEVARKAMPCFDGVSMALEHGEARVHEPPGRRRAAKRPRAVRLSSDTRRSAARGHQHCQALETRENSWIRT